MRKAEIYQQGTLAGILEELDQNHYQLVYASGYCGEPISLALPAREAPYEFDKFPPVFEGLLPEGLGSVRGFSSPFALRPGSGCAYVISGGG